MEFQTQYTRETNVRPVTMNKEPTMTKQSLKDNQDVNKIIKRYEKTGVLGDLMKFEGQFGEVDSISYHEAMNLVANANSEFEKVPSAIRAKFHNDPGEFIDYATNPENQEQMIKWGLANPLPPLPDDAPIKVEITNTETTKPAEA